MEAFSNRVLRRLTSFGLSAVLAIVAAWVSSPAAAPVTALASGTGPKGTPVTATAVSIQPGADTGPASPARSFNHYIQPKGDLKLGGTGGAGRSSSQGRGGGSKAGVWSSSNWPGINFADVSTSAKPGPTPPDPNGVVGPNNYMEAVNGKFAVYDRTGHQLAAASDDYFAGRNRQTPQRFMSDPTLNYDARTNRWFYQEASYNAAPDCAGGHAVCNFEIDFGWSATEDPSNLGGNVPQNPGWCHYTLNLGPNLLYDYTKTAVDDNWMYFASNIFDYGAGGAFASANIIIMPKPPTSGRLTSCPGVSGYSYGSGGSQLQHPGTTEPIGTIKPVDTYSTSQGGGANVYLASAKSACQAGGRHEILIMHVGSNGPPPALYYDGEQTVSNFSCPPYVPEPNGNRIDTLDGRIAQGAAIPDPSHGGMEGLWLAHTVALGTGADNIAIQWYEILMPVSGGNMSQAPSLGQQGSVGGGTPAGVGKFTFAWNSGIAPAKVGNEGVLTYNWSEAPNATGTGTTRTQLRAVSHDASLPAGAMALPVTLANSLDDPVDYSCSSTCRWGDYAAATTDPKEDHVVWGTGMWTGLSHPDPTGSGANMAQWASSNFAISSAASQATASGPYVPLSPYRVLDTRLTAQLGPNSTLDVPITGTSPGGGGSGVPNSGVGAAALNVTAVGGSLPSYLTVYPSGRAKPLASTINFAAGTVTANLTQVPVGAGGAVTVYNSQGTVNVLLDVQGYTLSALQTNTAGLYKSLPAPARILDSRPSSQVGPYNSPFPINGTRDVTVPLPDSRASAVLVNVTAVNPSTDTYLTAFPTGATRPVASNVNASAGKTVPNRVMVQLGTGADAGKFSIYNSAGPTDVVVDFSGWFTDGADPAAIGGTFHPLTPARVLDTRAGSAIGQYNTPFGPGTYRVVQIAGMAGVPAGGASSVVGNLTATGVTGATLLTTYPADAQPPATSDLNVGPGDTRANMIVVRLAGDQSVYVYNVVGTDDVIVDVSGYYG